MSGIATVAAITVICYLICLTVKALMPDDMEKAWLPVIAGTAGAALGVVGIFYMQEFPAQDIMTAMAVGIVSGLAATGTHEITHLWKKKE